MTCVGSFILFGLSCLFSCEGTVFPPSNGTTLIFAPGSTEKIVWSYNDVIDGFSTRLWSFESPGGKVTPLVQISGVNGMVIASGVLDVAVEKPATLVLKNVNETYNGTFKFDLQASTGGGDSKVVVFIAVAPNATINRTSPAIVNEGDDFTCGCRGEGGNPPADVTWYDKDGVQIGGIGKVEQTLNLINVSGADNGTYKCEAQSHINATDEESIEVILNFKPKNTTLTANKAVVGTSVVITCNSEGLPEPTYIITLRNGTVVSTDKTYTIDEVKLNDTGTCAYECIASNKLGNDSACSNLTVEPRPATTIPPTKSSGKSSGKQPSTPTTTGGKTTTTKAPPDCLHKVSCIVPIVIAVVVVVVVLVIIFCLVYRYKKRENDDKRKSNVSPGVPINHYELDEEPDGGVDNAYDTVNTSGASGSKSKPPKESTLPPVYAAVDKSNKDGKPLYATLDTVALQSNNSKKKRDEERPGQTEYASIDFAKIEKVDEE